MSNRNSYTDEYQRLPCGLRVVYYDAERGIHQYRDEVGQLWESSAGNTYGELHRIDDTPAYFRSERAFSPTPSSAPSRTSTSASTTGAHTPMTEFPTIWDAPADYEVNDLPSGKRIAAKLGNYRRAMFGGSSSLSRNSSASSRDSATSSRSLAMPTAVPKATGLAPPPAPAKGRTF